MSREFRIEREVQLPVGPEEVWDALTTNVGAWLWPMEVEPKLGGSGPFGSTVTAWDPPSHYANRVEGPDGWFNELDHLVQQRPDGSVWLRYVHSGVFVDNWDNQYDGADKHTDFYLHTLGEYLRNFAGKSVTAYIAADGPAAAGEAGAFDRLATALALPEAAQIGDRVAVPASVPLGATADLDYRNPYFIGLRTTDAMYRFFGRNHFGMTVGLAVHHFGDVDQAELAATWQRWLDELYV